MPYVKRTTRAGKTIEIEKYYTARYNKKGVKRSDRVKPTTAQQKEINERAALRKLRLLMNANFTDGDLYITLSYMHEKGMPYITKTEMKTDIQKFLRECRKEYKKQNREFKYIHVMEIGPKGARHHHLVINHIDTKILQKAWNKASKKSGWINIKPLNSNGQYADLAKYFIKYSKEHLKDSKENRLQGKRWAASKNLIHPEPEYEIISDKSWFRSEAKAPKGWQVDKARTERGITSPEYGGFGYFRYTLIKLDQEYQKTEGFNSSA